MRKFRFSLRFKLTAIAAGVMSICCLLLTAVSLSTSAQMVEALPLMQPVLTFPADSDTTGAVSCEPAQIASVAQDRFQTQNLAAMVLVILAGSAAAYWLVRRQLRPLEQLAASVKALEADNMAQIKVPLPNTRDESYQLALALDDMITWVGQAYAGQKEFAASAAHELRTPLASMQSRLEVFLMKERTPDEYQQLLQRFDGNLKRLNTLVEQLLQLSSSHVPDTKCGICLGDIVEDAVCELAPVLEQKTVDINLEDHLQVDGNPALYRQLVLNLLQNAAKYGGDRIRVHLAQQENQVILRVEDNGPGIPDTAKEHIFEPFYRVDRSRSRRIGGNGLGLSIVRRIARQYGGDATVGDSPLGGACFVIHLPLSKSG